ncbi:MAG: hypothetical protein U0792_24330 [Gemmataceae bacterium]
MFEFRDRVYLMRAVGGDGVSRAMRQRSPAGVMHQADFRKAVKPFSHFLGSRVRRNRLCR